MEALQAVQRSLADMICLPNTSCTQWVLSLWEALTRGKKKNSKGIVLFLCSHHLYLIISIIFPLAVMSLVSSCVEVMASDLLLSVVSHQEYMVIHCISVYPPPNTPQRERERERERERMKQILTTTNHSIPYGTSCSSNLACVQ